MSDSEPLKSVLEKLAYSVDGAAVFGADEMARWPAHAFEALVNCGLLQSAEPAQIVACDGCERNCFKPVEVRVANAHRPAHAFIACDEPEDVGRVPVKPSRLQQFQITGGTLARLVARWLGCRQQPQPKGVGKCWSLGLLGGGESAGVEIQLSIDGSVTLSASDRVIPLTDLLSMRDDGLRLEQNAVSMFVGGADPTEVGSIQWRKRNAKRAANAKHDRPGGSREKQKRMRELWASGKYSTRDVCAEQECAALGMSFSAARKALINTPEP